MQFTKLHQTIYLSITCLIFSSLTHAEIMVMAISGNKAIISIDGAPPKSLSIGQSTQNNIKLLAIQEKSATFDVQGKKQTIPIGGYFKSSSTTSSNEASETGNNDKKVILKAQQGGHFFADVYINGKSSSSFLIDTGATTIAIPLAQAQTLGLNIDPSQTTQVNTANGLTTAYRVTLKSVRIGTIIIHNVEAMIVENLMGPGLLGMSFLSKVKMVRESNLLTLTK